MKLKAWLTLPSYSPLCTFRSSESPEHHMADIKGDPGGWDTDSSGGGQQQQQPQRLQPSGAALRKSQSALELGAWKKIAAGDLDFVDPSGSVREQLQGLDYLQVRQRGLFVSSHAQPCCPCT